MTDMTNSPIDATVYGELKAATGAEFTAELVDAFLEDSPAMILALQSALATGDADQFRRVAHTIKSNANVFGAHALAKPARQLELGELDTNSGAVKATLDRLHAEYARAAIALRSLKNG
ncbi:MAG: Hpt domain-containing protein [Hydrogenophaga sp.]|uniref:Hpt domain-containing protein n=1 Tax=Hydrogenophaga sp. TaxID=1904254 RepID=UPI00276096F1|nr:Hpt domain-containing protein [Hydrogenophaga sp.]MDP2402050.1 Hpt domain-containing protein [Actinomycetota bacterium]MDZ4189087.1 Hpt domain-containing protein [Hydrogenophaga sp.]